MTIGFKPPLANSFRAADSSLRESVALARLAQPLHRELDILRLQMAPALDFGLVSIFWEALEIFRGQLFGGCSLAREFFAELMNPQ